MADLIKAVEAKKNENIPELRPGDSVNVHVKIKEGDRERIQEFKGTVIRLRKGGNEASFTVRRVASPDYKQKGRSFLRPFFSGLFEFLFEPGGFSRSSAHEIKLCASYLVVAFDHHFIQSR